MRINYAKGMATAVTHGEKHFALGLSTGEVFAYNVASSSNSLWPITLNVFVFSNLDLSIGIWSPQASSSLLLGNSRQAQVCVSFYLWAGGHLSRLASLIYGLVKRGNSHKVNHVDIYHWVASTLPRLLRSGWQNAISISFQSGGIISESHFAR